MEVTSNGGKGLDNEARQAFADLLARIMGLVEKALSEASERGEFNGVPDIAALHLVTVSRGLAVMERAFSDKDQLQKIASHTINLILANQNR